MTGLRVLCSIMISIIRKYAVYFSSDDETVFVDSDESDIEIVKLKF